MINRTSRLKKVLKCVKCELVGTNHPTDVSILREHECWWGKDTGTVKEI